MALAGNPILAMEEAENQDEDIIQNNKADISIATMAGLLPSVLGLLWLALWTTASRPDKKGNRHLNDLR